MSKLKCQHKLEDILINKNYFHNQLLNYLKEFTLLSQNDINQIEKLFFKKEIKKNQYFIKAGDNLKYIGFNLQGIFRYFYIDYEGNEKTKYFGTKNEFIFSLSSFIKKIPSLYFIETLEDSELLLAPVEKIYELINNNILWQNIYKSILEKTYIFKEKREADFLLFNAKDRYLNFIEEYPEIHNNVKQHYIASYLGIAPESLSRIRSELEIS